MSTALVHHYALQKAALAAELLSTRAERDGYLADRTTQQRVLAVVRATRDALLAAHAGVEASLTADCGTLKMMIARALDHVETLHVRSCWSTKIHVSATTTYCTQAEIERKRDISVANERAADEFCDDVTTRLRSIMEVGAVVHSLPLYVRFTGSSSIGHLYLPGRSGAAVCISRQCSWRYGAS
jgi:hypothetical protein